MSQALSDVLTLATAVGSGALGGGYYIFSAMVMPALRKRPPSEAIKAMNQINVDAVRPPFMLLFGGTSLLSIALIVYEFAQSTSWMRIIGAVLSLSGFVITASYNVPRNNRLAAVDPAAADAHDSWDAFARQWTGSNHCRALVSITGAIVLSIAMLNG